VNWRKCVNHRAERADTVCPKCVRGYCPACVQVVQGGAICGECDGLCVTAVQYGEVVQQQRDRERPLLEDINVILGYPLRDRVGFVLLALFTWFFGLFAGLAPIAFLLSQGVLLWYAFYALSRVASGNLQDFMPDMRDLSDLAQPARLAAAAYLISWGPTVLVALLLPGSSLPFGIGSARQETAHPDAVYAQSTADPSPATESDEADESEKGESEKDSDASGAGFAAGGEGPGAFGVLLLIAAVAWKILYTPVALVVAALSRSFLSTINPAIGVWAIGRMGPIYWQCLGIYCALAFTQWILGLVLGLIPIAGGLVLAFVNAYAWLAIACTLGLGVYKKAPELGWD
jgi:hypothetical protein